jgi:hypothetical protein
MRLNVLGAVSLLLAVGSCRDVSAPPELVPVAHSPARACDGPCPYTLNFAGPAVYIPPNSQFEVHLQTYQHDPAFDQINWYQNGALIGTGLSCCTVGTTGLVTLEAWLDNEVVVFESRMYYYRETCNPAETNTSLSTYCRVSIVGPNGASENEGCSWSALGGNMPADTDYYWYIDSTGGSPQAIGPSANINVGSTTFMWIVQAVNERLGLERADMHEVTVSHFHTCNM